MSVFLPYPHTGIFIEPLTLDKIIGHIQPKFLGLAFGAKKGKSLSPFPQ
jgi:hypothetical protein